VLFDARKRALGPRSTSFGYGSASSGGDNSNTSSSDNRANTTRKFPGSAAPPAFGASQRQRERVQRAARTNEPPTDEQGREFLGYAEFTDLLLLIASKHFGPAGMGCARTSRKGHSRAGASRRDANVDACATSGLSGWFFVVLAPLTMDYPLLPPLPLL
jgi:hypothetical protein